jgi:phage terminase large subunit GpA-like protein
MTAAAAPRIFNILARVLAPRARVTVSEWADDSRELTTKGSSIPGQWRTDRNPLLREPMDCMSKHSKVHESVNIFPIQFGKTEIQLNVLGCTMDTNPCPIIVFLPDDITMNAWIEQKLTSLIDGTPAVQRALTTTNSRNSSNQKAFKDFAGGQLFIEHAKTATRMTLKSAVMIIVDELDKMAAALTTGEDPLELIRGRTSGSPNDYKHCFTGTPGLKGVSRLDEVWEESDQRKYYVPCPHCGHEQPLEWSGLQWTPDGSQCWYMCRECTAVIEEHHKTEMMQRGRWVAEKPGRQIRGYRANCLYYQFGMGPRWLDLVRMWRKAQSDPRKLQVFITERLAESWEDPAMRQVKHNIIADRVEGYRLRSAPLPVLAVTCGVDTQDDRLEAHITGWSRNLQAWTLDYFVVPGDPENEDTWLKLVDILNRPIEHAGGGLLRVEATAIDAAGHRTQAVYNFVRRRLIRRPMAIFGAKTNNAPVLSKGKLQDINWRGQLDKRGVTTHQVGTVSIKHLLYSRISTDTEKQNEARFIHLSDELPPEYFTGLVSEIYDPIKNRFVKRGGARNEPLDTWVYAYAATHHPELRLHRRSRADWDEAERRLLGAAPKNLDPETPEQPEVASFPTTTRTFRRGNRNRGI